MDQASREPLIRREIPVSKKREKRVYALSWSEYLKDIVRFGERLLGLAPGGIIHLYGIPRGGRILVDVLSHQNILPTGKVFCCSHSVDGSLRSLTYPAVVVVIDDVWETGRTLLEQVLQVRCKVDNLYTGISVYPACLYLKGMKGSPPGSLTYLRRIPKKYWIVFPYETLEGESQHIKATFY